MKRTFTILFFLFIATSTFASTISGYILDKDSREQLVGASIILEPGPVKTASMLNGKYLINNVKSGTYTLRISYVGYHLIDTTLTINADENVKLNFYMKSNYATLNTVTISSTGNKESDAFAKRSEQRANNLINIVSAN